MSFSCRLCSASRVAVSLWPAIAERSLPEGAAHDRRVLHEDALRRARASRAARRAGPARCRAARTARRRPRRRGGAPSPRRRTGCRPARSATAATAPLSGVVDADQRRHQLARLLDRQRVEQDRGRLVAPAAPALAGGRSARRARGTAGSAARAPTASRYSIRSSMPWSAQWMSSNTSTSGLRRAIASITDRTAEKKTSRMRCGSSPSDCGMLERRLDAEQPPDHGGAALGRLGLLAGDLSSGRRPRQAASPTPPPCCRRRGCRPRRGSPRRAPSTRFPSRTGRQRPSRKVGGGWRWPSRRSSSWRRRDLPTPAWPITVTRCGAALALDPVVDGAQQVELVRAPDERRLAEARAARGLARQPRRSPPTPARARPCPSASAARAAGTSIAWLVARKVRSPTVTLPGCAADCRRAATFTVSPITV